MDETVYQCPECNFNADNLTELDGHITEFHSNEIRNADKQHMENMLGHHHNNDDDDEEEDEGDGGGGGTSAQNDETIIHNSENLNHDLNQDEDDDYLNENEMPINSTLINSNQRYANHVEDENELYNNDDDDYYYENQNNYGNNINSSKNKLPIMTNNANKSHNLRQKQAVDYNDLNGTSSSANVNNSNNLTNFTVPSVPKQTQQRRSTQQAPTPVSALNPNVPVINSDNHYERQYTCKRCGFFTNNPRAVLYHRKEFHFEKINVHECSYCQYASQYSGKVERHTLLRHKIDINNSPNKKSMNQRAKADHINKSSLDTTTTNLNLTDLANTTIPSTNNKNDDNLNSTLNNLNNSNKLINRNLNQSSSTSTNNTTTSQQSNLLNETLNSLAKFQCNKCPCKYKRSTDLSKHLKLKHGILAQRLSDYLVTTNSSTLGQINSASHDFEEMNQFADETDLNEELYNETNEQETDENKNNSTDDITETKANSYECPYCTYQSNGNDAEYLLHVKDHLAGKSFRCVLCNSVYKYRGDCVVHLKRKHQKADSHAQSYVERFNMEQVHIGEIYLLLKPKQQEETENEEKLFSCAYCDYKANYKGDVFKHQTRRHPGSPKNVTALNPHLNGGANGSLNQSMDGSFNMSYTNNNNNNKKASNEINQSYDDVNLKSVLNRNASRNLNLPIYNGGNHQNEDNGDEIIELDDDNNQNNDYYYDNNTKQLNGNANEHYVEDESDENGLNEYNDEENMFNEQDQNQDYNENYEQNDVEIINDYGDQDYNYTNNNEDIIDETMNQQSNNNQFQCKFCSFVGKNHAKLQLHLSTHYNLKPYMCPICNRRANFKWDIQKHLRKIHNNYTSEVICLSEQEARQSISSYIEGGGNNNTRRPASSLSSMSNNSLNSNKFNSNNTNNMSQFNDDDEENDEHHVFNEEDDLNGDVENNENLDGDLLEEDELGEEMGEENEDNLRLMARQRTQNAMKERKFKCSLCNRTSKWQWDIRKHLRTVHRGQQGGDVIILRENDKPISQQPVSTPLNQQNTNNNLNIRPKPSGLTIPLNGNTVNNTNRFSLNNNSNLNINRPVSLTQPQSFTNTTNIQRKPLPQSLYQPRTQSTGGTVVATCSDPTGNKKFQCTQCPYRSNWKADLFRHLKKRHFVQQPQLEHVVILDNEFAASSLEEYEQVHGIHVRKRNRPEFDMSQIINSNNTNNSNSINNDSMIQMNETKKPKLSHPQENSSAMNNGASNDDQNLEQENLDYLNRNNRLPVSIAELNIKPYKCLKCGFRSDRKSDTLRHIRVKHAQTVNAVKFLRIMSIAEASESIEAYENMRLYKKIKNFNSVDTNVGNIYAEANIYHAEMSETTNVFEQQLNQIKQQPILPQQQQFKQQPPQQIQPQIKLNTETSSNESRETKSCINSCCDYYRCPFCSFKNVSKLIMRRHLAIHFSNQKVKINPTFKCSICSFKSKWKFLIKKHILMNHLSTQNAYVLKVAKNNEIKQTKMNKNENLEIEQQPEIEEEEEIEEEYLEHEQIEEDEPIVIDTETSDSSNKQNTEVNEEETNEEDEEQTKTDNESYFNNDTTNLDDLAGGDKTTESVVLTDYNGTQFTATFMVSNPLHHSIGGGAQTAGVNRKKIYFCQTCPYKTCNYSNFRTHLLQHRYQEGYAKCRYCVYYVSKVRLLKQHEILHPEYELRLTAKQLKQQNNQK